MTAELIPDKPDRSLFYRPSLLLPGDFYIGQTVDGEFGISSIGGTSLAGPLIVGIQAVASRGRRFAIGFANPLLYSMRSGA